MDMKRLATKVPPPLHNKVEEFRDEEGYENQSQAVRELLRRGMNE